MQNIREKIVNYYLECSTDAYGQIKTIDIYQLIDGKDEEQLAYLKSVMQVVAYGWTYGTYYGVAPWGAFKDATLEADCRKAFAQNKNRERNLNTW
jgi:hypothetical protein